MKLNSEAHSGKSTDSRVYLARNDTYLGKPCVPVKIATMRNKVEEMYLDMVVDPQVRKFCGPLFFISSNTTPKGAIKGSGTFGLIDTGRMKLLVTCWHVLFGEGGFKDVHAGNSEFRFGIGFGGKKPHSVFYDDLMGKIVDESRRCDLVTLDVGDALDLVAASNLAFYNLKANRPPKVNVGEILYFIGFPGKGRVEDEKSVGHVRQAFGIQVAQVNESNFMASVLNLKLDETDCGGMSGAPCFVVEDGKPIRLVGFVTDYGGALLNMIQFTYARYIGDDGIIRYMD